MSSGETDQQRNHRLRNIEGETERERHNRIQRERAANFRLNSYNDRMTAAYNNNNNTSGNNNSPISTDRIHLMLRAAQIEGYEQAANRKENRRLLLAFDQQSQHEISQRYAPIHAALLSPERVPRPQQRLVAPSTAPFLRTSSHRQLLNESPPSSHRQLLNESPPTSHRLPLQPWEPSVHGQQSSSYSLDASSRQQETGESLGRFDLVGRSQSNGSLAVAPLDACMPPSMPLFESIPFVGMPQEQGRKDFADDEEWEVESMNIFYDRFDTEDDENVPHNNQEG